MKKKTKMRSKKNARKTKRIRGGAASQSQSSKRARNSGENTDHRPINSGENTDHLLEVLKEKDNRVKTAKIALNIAINKKSDPSNDDTPEIEELYRKRNEALEERIKAVVAYQKAVSKKARILYTPDDFRRAVMGPSKTS